MTAAGRASLRGRSRLRQRPGCVGGRCVCDQRACRIGCRPGPAPPASTASLTTPAPSTAATTTPEPNDSPGQASVLDLGRRSPRIERTGTLCGTSAVDWADVHRQATPSPSP
ncbi:MAG: hypothetical protein R3F43_04120 [bacterium]